MQRLGQTTKGYTFQKLIGAGGFGSVYQAQQAIINRLVAIKVINAEYVNQPAFVLRFEAEAQMVARLEHPNIVPLYDYWRHPDGAYLVMRYLRGGNLRHGLAHLTPEQAYSIIEQIAAALDYAHQLGVVHLDIKPDNILMDGVGNVYLSDFGIARELVGLRVGSDQNYAGSPPYMSPEVILGEELTIRSDVYSFGVMLYELLTGVLPFQGAEHIEIMHQHLHAPVPSIHAIREDLPPGLDEVLWQAMAKSPNARYPSIRALMADYRENMREQIPLDPQQASLVGAITSADQIITAGAGRGTRMLTTGGYPRNPYKGLRAFQPLDANDFFGREPLVTDIIARLTAADPVRLLTIIGPSGSGKSSLVGAGVVPALREQTQPWYVAQMTPGAAPLETLAETMRTLALAPYAGVLDWQDPTTLLAWLKTSLPQNAPILLVIDQFEELFTQTAPRKQQRAFIDNLVTAVEAKCLFVVLVLRADFYDRPMQFPALAPYLRQQTIIVLPLTESELERVIVAPAQRAGVNIQSELVLRLIFDMHQQPGALPLLQFTLTELVERAGTQPVTLDTYNLLGGISGTLALRADQLFLAMPEEWQPLMRRIFLQLITLDEDSTATRRRVTWQALDALTDQQMILQKILDTFGAARLVTFDRDPTTRLPTVEIAHEALIGAWGRLQAWLDDARLLLRTTQQLEFAVREWESHRQEASYLASGARLASFEDLATQTERPLDARARAFLGASLAQRGRYRARVRLAVVSLVVLVMLTSSLALVAVNQQSQAIEARNQADAQAALARSRELAALALLQTDQPDIAALLALASQEQATTFEAQHSLLTVLQEAAPRQYTLHHGEPVRALARSADGRYMATGGADGTLVWWDVLRQVRVAERSAALTGRVHSLAVHADWIAAGGVDGALTLWNPRTDDIQHLAAHGDDVWAVAWHPSGGRLASAGADGEIILWAVPSGEIQHRWAAHAETIFALAWHPDGEWLASGGANRDLVLWQAEDRRAHRTWQAAHEDWILALAFSADGTLLASGGAEAALAIWSPAQASALLRFESDHQDWVRDLDFHPTEPWLLSAGQDGSVQVWDALRGAALRAPLHAVSAVWAARFSADGTLIFSGDAAGQIAAWDWTQTLPYPAQGQLANTGQMIHDLLIRPVEGDVIIATGDAATPTSQPRLQHWSEAQGLVAHRSAQQGVVTSLALHPRGHLLAAGHADHQIGLWSLADWRPSTPALRGHIAPVFDLAFNPTGEYLASAGDDGRVVIWDAASDEPLHTLEDASAGVLALAFSPAGDYLVAGDRTGVIYIWDDSWQTPARLMAHDEAITSLAFHPAQPWLASGSRDGRIIIWDYQKGQIVRRLGGHAHWVMSLAFSPDGRLLASGGRDELLRLWHVALGRQLGDSLSSGGGWVTALAFSPDGDALVTGTSTGIIERWDVANAAWRERACAIANRELAPAEQGQFGLDAANFCALPTG